MAMAAAATSAVAAAGPGAATAGAGLYANILPLPDAPAGRFLVHELLGRGATATVFRGTDLVNDRPVAIKVAEGPTEQDASRIHAEARVLASLDHPAVVSFIAAGTVPGGGPWAGRPFLVEEFAYGGSLAERIRGGTTGPGEVASWAAAALSGLGHVHGHGLVHRDIKPGNILLSALRRCSVRLADFGIATPAGTAPEPGESSGTVHYMSPEQAAGQPLRPSSDIYALGLVLLECLTGVKTYPGTPVESLVARTLRAPDIPAELGAAWVSLLTAMTAMDPEARPSAAAAYKLATRLPGTRTLPPPRMVG
jgi:eukaryotic-like serine/threonine-protein kinase